MNAAPARKTLYLCGDCATILLAAGVERSPDAVISLGRQCELHPASRGAQQATNILEADPGRLDELSAATHARGTDPWGALARPPEPQLSLGPLTEAALRLLVAWTTADKGTNADAVTIQFVVNVARELLATTGGQ